MLRVRKIPQFLRTKARLNYLRRIRFERILKSYGDRGVQALADATPVDTGVTAQSWDYIIEEKNGYYRLIWTNSEMAGTVPLVILLQYGHGTGTGGWVVGKDFINPALDDVFSGLINSVRSEVAP